MKFAALIWAAALPAYAEESGDGVDVDGVVVTATRLPAPLLLSPGVRVIDRAALDAEGAVFAVDALKSVPGLSVFETGSFGGVGAVRIRGASADKTLVLIDGIPQNDASQPAGNFDFAAFDLSDVDRIEILSGPQGSLWGSDAIGGVIAFTTRERDGISASVEAGAHGTARGAVSLGRSEDRWAAGLTVSGLRSDGISKADEADGNPEADGLKVWSVSAQGRYELTDSVRLDARLRWTENRTEIDGYQPPLFTFGDTPEISESAGRSGLLRATVQGPLGFEQQFSLSASDIDRSSTGGSFPYSYDAARQVWRWTATRARPGESWGLAVGAEREDVQARLSDGTDDDAGASSVFAVLRLQPFERLTTTTSLRWDDADGYEAVATARASAVFDAGHGLALEASWGQGFKTPTISQTACDFCFPTGPSLGLRPERAEGWDVAARWRSADGRFDAKVTGWRLAVRDEIDFYFDPLTFDFRYRNIEHALSKGLELEGSAELGGGFALRGAWAWTDAVDQATGARLLRVPQNQVSAALAWTGERGHARLAVRGESDQADAGGIREGFVVADLAGGWRLNEHVEATLRIENLGDVHYQEVLFYGEPGRSAYAGLMLRY